MSRICQGCGGVLGRDCYNEYDCIQISRNMEINDYAQPYIEALKHARELIQFMDNNMELNDTNLIETYHNNICNTMNELDSLIPIERTPEQYQNDLDDLPF